MEYDSKFPVHRDLVHILPLDRTPWGKSTCSLEYSQKHFRAHLDGAYGFRFHLQHLDQQYDRHWPQQRGDASGTQDAEIFIYGDYSNAPAFQPLPANADKAFHEHSRTRR